MNGKRCILTSKNRVLTCDFSCHFGRPSAKRAGWNRANLHVPWGFCSRGAAVRVKLMTYRHASIVPAFDYNICPSAKHTVLGEFS